MIVSCNAKPSPSDFNRLVEDATSLLNGEAAERSGYYLSRTAHELEKDVERQLKTAAIGTAFEDSIEIMSGRFFPDIVAKKYYGVEVKSTKSNKWTSIGSSVMESSRGEDIERIYLTFGKLSDPVEFRSRPYEDCLSGASVTHSPRYKIDMNLKKGETIFELMNTTYDELRMSNPEFEIIKYYKSKLKHGERLWWSGSGEDDATDIGEMKVRLAKELSTAEKKEITAWGLSLFPEIMLKIGNYEQFALWMAAERRVVSPSTRDFFTSGGRGEIVTSTHHFMDMPGDFLRIDRYKDKIVQNILSADEGALLKSWNVDKIKEDRVGQWIDCVCKFRELENHDIRIVLESIFGR